MFLQRGKVTWHDVPKDLNIIVAYLYNLLYQRLITNNYKVSQTTSRVWSQRATAVIVPTGAHCLEDKTTWGLVGNTHTPLEAFATISLTRC